MKSNTNSLDANPPPISITKRCLLLTGVALVSLLFSQSILAQLPSDLPWDGSTINGRKVILQPGIAGASCGTIQSLDPTDRFTFGLFNIDQDKDDKDVIPASGRIDRTPAVEVYHHPDWLVEKIGNVFGVAINERSGDIFLSASSNYGGGFFRQAAELRYGDLGGGRNNVEAAGTVYRIDAVTGEASVFAELPQQSFKFRHLDCEGPDPEPRPKTGVGLGNIHYDRVHDQFFVTNIEDGRIYRLGPTGDIRDSYDPGNFDDGQAGISALTDLVYGVSVEPGGDRLFFGGVSISGDVPLWSIDLSPTGGFVGTINDSGLPTGTTWHNYVGDETPHTTVTAETSGVPTKPVHMISDLEFTPDSRLLVGIRVGCNESWFTSYNHTGESDVLTKDGSGLYGSSMTELDVSDDSFAAEDAYGGVSYYEHFNGSVDFVVSSGDIINDRPGPHGIAVFRSADANEKPITPLAAISYGVADDGDPKGVGGSLDVLSSDPPCLDPVTFETLCVVEEGSATGEFTWRFRIKNESGGPIHHLFVNDLPPGVSADPQHVVFDPPIPDGGFSRHSDRLTDTITFTGATPGTVLDFSVSIHDAQIAECCAERITLELPDCECAQIVSEQRPACFLPPFISIPPPYRYRVDLQNLSDRTAKYFLTAAVEPSDLTTPILPDDLRVRGSRALAQPAQPGETTGSVNFLIDGPGAKPGREVCLFLSINDAAFRECCSIPRCFTLPNCTLPITNPPEPFDGTLLDFEGGEIVLSGFGDGVGGIDVEIPGTNVLATSWAPIDPVDGQGAEIRVTTFGLEEEELATAQARELGGEIEIRAAFQQQRDEILVEVLDGDGSVVTAQTSRSDRVAVTLDTWPAGFVMIENLEGITILGHEDSYSARLPDGTRVQDAVIRIRDATETPSGSLGSAALRVQGLDELRLRTLQAIVDCDGDGVPDDEAIAQGLVEDLDGNGVPDGCQERQSMTLIEYGK